MFSWGFGRQHGVLGYSSDDKVRIPRLIASLRTLRIAGLSCGNNFTLAWTTDGEALSWGYGHHGVLGHGDESDQTSPRTIQALDKEKVVHMNAGFAHCGAVTDAGFVFMFGKGKDGALGLGKAIGDQLTPKLVKSLPDVRIRSLSCSLGGHHGHTLAVDDLGTVYAWGDGYKGKLGLGDMETRSVPTQIPPKNFNTEYITQVSAGGIHSAAVSREGHVFTWGCGSDGRLGHPEAKGHRYLFKSDVPRVVDYLDDIGEAVAVSCSYYHTAALVTPSRTKTK
jgi:alpha-tubulin suppressor-like RCC1 family protein